MQIISGAVKEMQTGNKKKGGVKYQVREEREENIKSREKQRREEEVCLLAFSLTAAVWRCHLCHGEFIHEKQKRSLSCL